MRKWGCSFMDNEHSTDRHQMVAAMPERDSTIFFNSPSGSGLASREDLITQFITYLLSFS